jgi:hypothetical protein
MSHRPSRTVPPFVTPRRLITFVLLITSVVVILVAQTSFKRPSLWRWTLDGGDGQKAETPLQSEVPSNAPSQALLSDILRGASYLSDTGQPATSPGSLWGACLGRESAEFVPLPETTVAGVPRHAPYPQRRLLSGAADDEPFLVPADDAPPELQASAKALGDAQARYHLLQLAYEAPAGSLEADGKAVRYQALKQRPEEFRGELVSVSGTLISVGEPFELRRKVPGLDFCYLGVLSGTIPGQSYLLFFTELPEGLPPNQSDWQQLYLHDVNFTGYFYKVAKFQEKGKKEPWTLPVLVGKSLQLPSRSAASDGWFNIISIFVMMALPVVLIALFLPRFFRHRDARHRQLMERFGSQRNIQHSPDWWQGDSPPGDNS